MIDKIGLWQRAVTALQRAQEPASVQPAGAAAREPTAGAPPPAQQSLNAAVRQSIARIRPDDPQRRRKALRAVVEVGLLREFGALLEQDPQFYSMVDQVVETLESSPALTSTVDEALRTLGC